MRKFGVFLALIAVVSLSLFPIVDASAATSGSGSLIDQARRGSGVMISREQMATLAKTRPALHAKLQSAIQTQVAPKLTSAEKSHLRYLSMINVKQIKAGQAAQVTVNKAATEPAKDTSVWADAGKCVASAAAFGAAVAVAVPVAGIPVALIVAVVGTIGCAVYFFFPLVHGWANTNAAALGIK